MECEAFDWPLLGCFGCERRLGRRRRLDDFRGSARRRRLITTRRARKSSYLSDFVLLEINADRSFNCYDDYISLKYLLLIYKLKF